ncbi:MAG: hypothetical protein ACE37F_21735 [Nannocystaceae bacterium]|nr:hypothetical protein [bacterium]
MGKLRSLWSLILFGTCAGLAYQGFQNTRIPHPADAKAQEVACEDMLACGGPTANWTGLDTSPFARIYTLESGSGPVTIECRWAMVMFGAVTCTGAREEVAPHVDDTPARRPHELGRGVKAK